MPANPKKLKAKALLIDLDGTLVDSAEATKKLESQDSPPSDSKLMINKLLLRLPDG